MELVLKFIGILAKMYAKLAKWTLIAAVVDYTAREVIAAWQGKPNNSGKQMSKILKWFLVCEALLVLLVSPIIWKDLEYYASTTSW